MNRRTITIISLTTILLAGCADDPAGRSLIGPDAVCADDSTLISGKQPGETKRHADDWAGPVADGFMEAFAGWITQAGNNSNCSPR